MMPFEQQQQPQPPFMVYYPGPHHPAVTSTSATASTAPNHQPLYQQPQQQQQPTQHPGVYVPPCVMPSFAMHPPTASITVGAGGGAPAQLPPRQALQFATALPPPTALSVPTAPAAAAAGMATTTAHQFPFPTSAACNVTMPQKPYESHPLAQAHGSNLDESNLVWRRRRYTGPGTCQSAHDQLQHYQQSFLQCAAQQCGGTTSTSAASTTGAATPQRQPSTEAFRGGNVGALPPHSVSQRPLDFQQSPAAPTQQHLGRFANCSFVMNTPMEDMISTRDSTDSSSSSKTTSGGSNTFYYMTKDMITEPPTPIAIRFHQQSPSRSVSSHRSSHSSSDEKPAAPPATAVAVLDESDVEPTEGWRLAREGKKDGLSVCFMHAFGRCVGRGARGPSHCLQIHIKPARLTETRLSNYWCFLSPANAALLLSGHHDDGQKQTQVAPTHPQQHSVLVQQNMVAPARMMGGGCERPLRRFYCRTVRAALDPETAAYIASRVAAKRGGSSVTRHRSSPSFAGATASHSISNVYVEFKLDYVRETSALYAYEDVFRKWLFKGQSKGDRTASAAAAADAQFQQNEVFLCVPYAVGMCEGSTGVQCGTGIGNRNGIADGDADGFGCCPDGPRCKRLHAPLSATSSRDEEVLKALRAFYRTQCNSAAQDGSSDKTRSPTTSTSESVGSPNHNYSTPSRRRHTAVPPAAGPQPLPLLPATPVQAVGQEEEEEVDNEGNHGVADRHSLSSFSYYSATTAGTQGTGVGGGGCGSRGVSAATATGCAHHPGVVAEGSAPGLPLPSSSSLSPHWRGFVSSASMDQFHHRNPTTNHQPLVVADVEEVVGVVYEHPPRPTHDAEAGRGGAPAQPQPQPQPSSLPSSLSLSPNTVGSLCDSAASASASDVWAAPPSVAAAATEVLLDSTNDRIVPWGASRATATTGMCATAGALPHRQPTPHHIDVMMDRRSSSSPSSCAAVAAAAAAKRQGGTLAATTGSCGGRVDGVAGHRIYRGGTAPTPKVKQQQQQPPPPPYSTSNARAAAAAYSDEVSASLLAATEGTAAHPTSLLPVAAAAGLNSPTHAKHNGNHRSNGDYVVDDEEEDAHAAMISSFRDEFSAAPSNPSSTTAAGGGGVGGAHSSAASTPATILWSRGCSQHSDRQSAISASMMMASSAGTASGLFFSAASANTAANSFTDTMDGLAIDGSLPLGSHVRASDPGQPQPTDAATPLINSNHNSLFLLSQLGSGLPTATTHNKNNVLPCGGDGGECAHPLSAAVKPPGFSESHSNSKKAPHPMCSRNSHKGNPNNHQLQLEPQMPSFVEPPPSPTLSTTTTSASSLEEEEEIINERLRTLLASVPPLTLG